MRYRSTNWHSDSGSDRDQFAQKNIGDGHTIANQINEVLEPYDLGVLAASNDRIGGWQLMYQMLQKSEWQVADTCRKLIEAIPSRMHDEKRPGGVLKVPGDPLDDVADDARYGIYTFITTTEKPRELAIAEDCRQFAPPRFRLDSRIHAHFPLRSPNILEQ